MAVFKALETTIFPVLLRIFCFEVSQQFHCGKHQHISINVNFAALAIYLPICPFQEERILFAQLLKEINIQEKEKQLKL